MPGDSALENAAAAAEASQTGPPQKKVTTAQADFGAILEARRRKSEGLDAGYPSGTAVSGEASRGSPASLPSASPGSQSTGEPKSLGLSPGSSRSPASPGYLPLPTTSEADDVSVRSSPAASPATSPPAAGAGAGATGSPAGSKASLTIPPAATSPPAAAEVSAGPTGTPAGSQAEATSPGAPPDQPSPGIRYECPICCCDYKLQEREAFSCGVHACCFDCASRHVQIQVEGRKWPRCFEKGCMVETDPLLIQRLLGDNKDAQDQFLQVALWSNPQVQACPKCRTLLFTDQGSTDTRFSCDACSYVFCLDCRCPWHPGTDCATAVKNYAAKVLAEGATTTGDLIEPASSSEDQPPPARPSDPEEASDDEDSRRGIRRPMRSVSTQQFEHALLKGGCKPCPRCRMGVDKSDDGCDHMTCGECRHEFCWSCGAPHLVIKAHGNHHHLKGCKFYAEWNGEDRYLPKECYRCALRGDVCTRFRENVTLRPTIRRDADADASANDGPTFAEAMAAIGQFFRSGLWARCYAADDTVISPAVSPTPTLDPSQPSGAIISERV